MRRESAEKILTCSLWWSESAQEPSSLLSCPCQDWQCLLDGICEADMGTTDCA
ncbi:hypothetical protein NPIL_329391, partial [Nephila pilipes]